MKLGAGMDSEAGPVVEEEVSRNELTKRGIRKAGSTWGTSESCSNILNIA